MLDWRQKLVVLQECAAAMSLDLERLAAPCRTEITVVRAPSSDPSPANEQSAATCARELGDRRGAALSPGERIPQVESRHGQGQRRTVARGKKDEQMTAVRSHFVINKSLSDLVLWFTNL